MQRVTQPTPFSCTSCQNQEVGAAYGADGATSSRDPDDPEELTGAGVHRTTEGWTPALVLDTLIILC